MLSKKARLAFMALVTAAKENRLIVAEGQDIRTRKKTFTVCEITQEGSVVTYEPLARLFNGNPLNEVTAPGVAAKLLM